MHPISLLLYWLSYPGSCTVYKHVDIDKALTTFIEYEEQCFTKEEVTCFMGFWVGSDNTDSAGAWRYPQTSLICEMVKLNWIVAKESFYLSLDAGGVWWDDSVWWPASGPTFRSPSTQ
jgi:hypothetical protein